MSDKNTGKLLRRLRELARPEGQPGRWPWDEKPDKPGSWDEKPQKPGSWDEVPEDRHRGHQVTDGPDLVSLLYRADWTRLSLSADVYASRDRSQLEDELPPRPPSWLAFGQPWGPQPGLASLTDSVGYAGPLGFPGPNPARKPGGEWAEATEALGTEVLGTETSVGPAGPPFLFPNLFDVSWLLAYPLTDGPESLTDGRRGHRLRVGPIDRPILLWSLFPDEVVVDGELGIVLRWISLAGERPEHWYELRDVVAGPVDPGLFRPDIPPGVQVTEEPGSQSPRPGGSPQEPSSLPGKIVSWLGRQTGR